MRTRSRIATTLAVAALLASSLANTLPVRAQSSQSAASRNLEGAWWVSVAVYDCSTLAPRGNFTSMLLFSHGGTVTETTSNPAFLPGQRSVGFGNWSLNDDGTYSATDVAFILFAGGAAPFQPGTQKLIHSIALNADASQWTDHATVDFYTAAGAPIAPMHACATATASRLQ
jgi:hypothetical protein